MKIFSEKRDFDFSFDSVFQTDSNFDLIFYFDFETETYLKQNRLPVRHISKKDWIG